MPEIGQTILNYKIIEKTGSGSMGVDYKAEDTKLGRHVILRFLPEDLCRDTGRRHRLAREARAVAALAHPGIRTLHEVCEQNGTAFLVMDYSEGETLADRLKRGPLPVAHALDVAAQIASALDVAHQRGIIHRNLRPANVMLTKTGVRLLEFGLTDLVGSPRGSAEGSSSPTEDGALTDVETLKYMSPEQLEGKRTDARTDVFSFGVLLYEMLTGRSAFQGESNANLIATILEKEPEPLRTVQPLVPAALDRLVGGCLAKNPDDRRHSCWDIGLELRTIQEEPAPVVPVERRRSWRKRIAWTLMGMAIIAAIILGAIEIWRQRTEVEMAITHIMPPADSVSCFRDGFAVSPDGGKIAFVSLSAEGERLIWVRSLDLVEPEPLAGTDGASFPFWSPDGREIAYFSRGKLRRISADGGPVRIISRASLFGGSGSWGSKGVIAFADHLGGISRVEASGGEPVRLPIEGQHPFFLPDGLTFLYTDGSIGICSIDDASPPRKIHGGNFAHHAEWIAPDRLMFSRRTDSALFAQRVDLERSLTLGQPTVLSEKIFTPRGWSAFSVSPAGVAAFFGAPNASTDQRSRLFWVNRRSDGVRSIGPIDSYWWAKISHNGRSVAVNSEKGIWIFDAETGVGTRFTDTVAREENQAASPIWSPEDDRILFHAPTRSGGEVLRELPVAGGTPRDLISEPTLRFLATDWSPDARYLAITYNLASPDLAVFDTQKQKMEMVVATESNESDGQFSPDGGWIAYESDRTNSYEIYIQAFPNPGEPKRVSLAGGTHPRWRADGGELFYVAPDWTVMAVAVSLQPELKIGTPTPLFRMVMADIIGGFQSPYDVAPDGQHFLIIAPQNSPMPLTLVQNWDALLDR